MDTECWKLLVKKVFSLKELITIIQTLQLIKFVNCFEKKKRKLVTCSGKIRNALAFCLSFS